MAATAHAALVSQHAPYSRLLIAWVLWPLVTGVPAFIVTLAMTAMLRLLKIPRLAGT